MSQEQNGLTVNDLQAIINIINLSSQRGTFKAEEMSTVGAIYDRLTKFVSSIAAAQAEAEKASGEEAKDDKVGE
jgi:hypothetical protein